MTYQNLQRLIFIILIPLSIGLLWQSLRNKSDPMWQQTADLLRRDIVTIDHSPDLLRLLYNNFYADTTASDGS